MSARWTELENSLVAQLKTEPAFKTVQSAAAPGIANIEPNGWPAALLTVVGGKTIGKRAIAESLYCMKQIIFQVLVGTKIPDRIAGSSRLSTGGVFDLYDAVSAKLLGFSPQLNAPTINAIFPCYEEDFWIDRLEPGACDIAIVYSVNVEIQNFDSP